MGPLMLGGRRNGCDSWALSAIFVIVPSLVLAATAATPTPQPSATPPPTATYTPTSTPASLPEALALGKNMTSDYVAKNFSLVFGWVVQNPFKIETPKPASTGTPSPEATGTPIMTAGQVAAATGTPSTPLLLGRGSVEGKPFLEVGVRYRWAWQDRVSVAVFDRNLQIETIKMDPKYTTTASRIAALEAEKENATKALATLCNPDAPCVCDNLAACTDKAFADSAKALRGTIETKAGDIATLQAEQEGLLVNRLRAAEREAVRSWQRGQEDWPIFNSSSCLKFLSTFGCGSGQPCGAQHAEPAPQPAPNANGSPAPPPPPKFLWGSVDGFGTCFAPNNYGVRLGYVFDGGSPTGIGSLVGNSNVYGDLILGWDLAHASLPTSSPYEPPIRIAFGTEVAMSQSTDTDRLDLLGRYLMGVGMTLGVPLISPTPMSARTTDPDPVRPDPIVEFAVRVGAVNAAAPTFKSSDGREIEIKHGDADFSNEWGFGFDIEVNVPITERAGYLMARSYLNAGFDPSPWGIQIGYTIPLGTVWEALRR